jgi:hypothetical protein
MDLKYKLPKKYKDRWLKALRSGEFKQGTRCLRSQQDQYCCLGVAYEVNGGTWLPRKPGAGYSTAAAHPGRIAEASSKSVKLALSQACTVHQPEEFSVEEYLINRNDCQRRSFVQIANWVEKHL